METPVLWLRYNFVVEVNSGPLESYFLIIFIFNCGPNIQNIKVSSFKHAVYYLEF